MGQGDKLFLDIAGLPLVGHTWRRCDLFPDADEIILVIRDDARPLFKCRLERGALERVAFYGSFLDRHLERSWMVDRWG